MKQLVYTTPVAVESEMDLNTIQEDARVFETVRHQ